MHTIARASTERMATVVGDLRMTKHAKERMAERDVTMAEVREVLRNGKKKPHHSKLTCLVYHSDLDGMNLIYDYKTNCVITVFYNDRKSYVL